jgi:hypothetical protein
MRRAGAGAGRYTSSEVDRMTPYDPDSFEAGQDAGTRLSACVARLAAIQLVEDSRWWNRRRHRVMARALMTCAAELEGEADARRAGRGPGLSLVATGRDVA